MIDNASVSILIAEDNEVSRDMMSSVLRAQGYAVHGVSDGDEAIRLIGQQKVDLAFVDINMSPKGGFEFVRYLVMGGIKLPVVIVTGDESTDMLVEATALGVERILQKPVAPSRLLECAARILKKKGGANSGTVHVSTHDTQFTPEQLMDKALGLAMDNVKSGKGGAFGAVVADVSGRIVATGASGKSSRVDPTAHAEVMAIRRAAEVLGSADLSNCVLYCSSEPTKVGQAVISSVGISKVFYGLSHEDIGKLRDTLVPSEPVYEQLAHRAALEMFSAVQALESDLKE